MVALWLVCSLLFQAIQVLALAGDIVLCSWARHFTLTVPLSIQVYKMGTGKFTARGLPCDELASHPGGGGVEILLVASCYRNGREVVA